MKRIAILLLLLTTVGFAYSQTTYYWVGGVNPATGITTGSNWNTALNGTGSSRPSSTGATDILVIDGTNVGGGTPATGTVNMNVNGSITCAQMKFINNGSAIFARPTSGTSTITLNGESGEDFVVESGSTLSFTSTLGSIRMALAAVCTGRVSGTMIMVTPQQARFDNTTSGTPGSFIFTNGSSFTTNITSASSSYAFGGNTQSSEKWVVFEAGSHLYYDGGFSPMGNNINYMPIDFKTGSTLHIRVSNPTTAFGSFFNRKSFANIIVENNATLTSDGNIYRIDTLTINTGSTFITHTSGQTVVLGDITVNGSLSSDPTGTNELVLGGNVQQKIGGSGTIALANLMVAASADVVVNKSMSIAKTATVYGKLDFTTNQFTGAGNFIANTKVNAVAAGTGNLTAGNYFISNNAGVAAVSRGLLITGTGIAPNTTIVSSSATADTIFISRALLSGGSGVALSVNSNNSTLKTANLNGFDPASGSVTVTGTRTFQDGINYVINGTTTWPFGISTSGTTPPTISAEFVDINAAVTVNRGIKVSNHLLVNGKITLRPLDTIYVLNGATLTGTFNASKYIATGYNSGNGDQSILRYEGLASSTTLPIGTINYYLPVVLNPSASSNFTVAVFEGITTNGLIMGTPLTPAQKQNVVNAVWNINRLSGSGNSSLQLGWNAALEGSTFATLPGTDIGLIANTGSNWALPIGVGDNILNTVTATVSAFGAFSAGAVPPSQPFTFNPLPVKTYGNADFNGGAFSLNTTQPIIYTSNNPAVATIVAGNIHITGAGTAIINASQASDGFYPPASVNQLLTVNKAPLTITADNKTKFEAQPNPILTVTYSGFVLGETATVLLTQPTITTTATVASPPGIYPITVSGATAANYTITHVNGTLTIVPKQNQTITFNALPVKTYGNADFAAGATSTNSTIPITYTSSNTAVATIIGSTIHITGAGTTTITASQAGSAGFFPAPDVARTLTVNKAPLTVRVRDTTKMQGTVNPPFVITYTGFVLGETVANLTTAPVVVTVATTNSSPGQYDLSPQGGVSSNYSFTYISGKLTVLPVSGTTAPYLNAYMINSNTLRVWIYSVEPSLGDIIIYDGGGRPVVRKNIFMPVGFISNDVYVPSLSSGFHIVRVVGNGIDLQKKISIIR